LSTVVEVISVADITVVSRKLTYLNHLT
jgi:hypothetical protein